LNPAKHKSAIIKNISNRPALCYNYIIKLILRYGKEGQICCVSSNLNRVFLSEKNGASLLLLQVKVVSRKTAERGNLDENSISFAGAVVTIGHCYCSHSQ
jgi:hypothetical protein